jgi:hypothetical protein
VEVTVEQPDARGRIDVFARVQPKACLCVKHRIGTNQQQRLLDESPGGLGPFKSKVIPTDPLGIRCLAADS